MPLSFWRKKRGFRQTDLAKEIEVTPPLLSYFEQGKALPTRETLALMETVMDLTRYDLFTDYELTLHDKKKRPRKDFRHYHVHIKLPKLFKKVLNSKNFRYAGYKDMNDWFLYKVKQFMAQLKYIEDYEIFKKFYADRQAQKEKASSMRPDEPLYTEFPEQRKTASIIILEAEGKDNRT